MKFQVTNTLNRHALLKASGAEPAYYYSNMRPVDSKYVSKGGKLYVFVASRKWVGGYGYVTTGYTKRRIYPKPEAVKLFERTEKARAKREQAAKAELLRKQYESRTKLNAELSEDDRATIAKAALTAGLASESLYIQRNITKLADILSRGQEWGFTAKQVGALAAISATVYKQLAEEKAADAAADDRSQWIENGRYVIEGEVATVKEQHTDFGITWKMMIKSGVRKYWASIPRAMETPERGEVVRIKGTVERSSKDPLFGFVKRPVVA